mmetsp:Transcript_59926/g.82000  ORF Transcript_59926/g.82000 Transcript_59926/m.82000 type:complete len:102 (-) Transcript_59926:393-698(-)
MRRPLLFLTQSWIQRKGFSSLFETCSTMTPLRAPSASAHLKVAWCMPLSVTGELNREEAASVVQCDVNGAQDPSEICRPLNFDGVACLGKLVLFLDSHRCW